LFRDAGAVLAPSSASTHGHLRTMPLTRSSLAIARPCLARYTWNIVSNVVGRRREIAGGRPHMVAVLDPAEGEAREGREALEEDDAPVRGHPIIHEIHCKTLLNRVRPPMPFRWSINPYRGCAHACAYCYARPSHITFDMDGRSDFEGHIFAKINAAEVVRNELRRR